MKTCLQILLLAFVMLISCKNSEPVAQPEVSIDDNYVPVTNVATVVKVDTFNLKLETFLWRNFMPSVPVGGPMLNSMIFLKEVSEKQISGKFELISIQIVAEKTWNPTYSVYVVPTKDFEVAKLSNDGPQIEPGRYVDVVCEFKFVETGKIYKILASRQKVGRTD